MPSRLIAIVMLTCLAWAPSDASVLDAVVPEDMLENRPSATPSRLPPLALIATDAITTELASMKKIAPSDAGVAQIEGMIQMMNKESANPVSSHRCDAKDTTDQATCSAKTTKAGCAAVVDSDNKPKCTYQMDGGTKNLEDLLTSAKTSIDAAVTTMLSGVVTAYTNAKTDLRAIDTAIDNSKQTISSTDLEAIKTKASTWCTKKRALETATSDASIAATALTTKLNEPLSIPDVLVKDVGTIGPSDCSQANSNARGSACQASSCNLAPTIQNRIDTVRAEYLEASWVKFDKDALLSTAVTEESHSMGEFQGDVTATANNYHSMCGNSDQVHDTAVTLFNDNNAGRSTMYQSLGVILCHINHMSSGQTYNVPTDLLKSGAANPTTSASDCKDKLKSDTTIKADLFPDASSDEDGNKVCPALSAYENDIRNYGALGFDKDNWQPTILNCDATTAAPSGASITQCFDSNGASQAVVTTVAGNPVEQSRTACTQCHSDGIGADAKFTAPFNMALSPDGSHLYVIDGWTTTTYIRKMATTTPYTVTTLAGGPNGYKDSSDGMQARFGLTGGGTYSLAVSPDDRYLYVADRGAVRVIDQQNNNAVTTLAGSGTEAPRPPAGDGTVGSGETCGTSALRHPLGISISTDGTALFLAGYQCRNVVKVMVNGGAMTEIASFVDSNRENIHYPWQKKRADSTHGHPYAIATLDANTLLVFVSGAVRKLYKVNIADGTKTEIISYIPTSGMSVSADRSTLFMNDASQVVAFNLTLSTAQLMDTGRNCRDGPKNRHCPSQAEMVIAGSAGIAGVERPYGYADGVGTNAKFHSIMGVIPTADSSTIFVADHWYGVIRKIECQN